MCYIAGLGEDYVLGACDCGKDHVVARLIHSNMWLLAGHANRRTTPHAA